MAEAVRRRTAPLLGYTLLSALLLSALMLGLVSGDVKMHILDVLKMLRAGPDSLIDEAFKQSVIWQIRLPRVISSAISGAVLAVSGVIFQSVLRNPLAEPYTLGVASGAAFGAACAIVAGVPLVSGAAFVGSISTLFIVWVLGERRNETDISRIILAGVIVGSILTAGLTLLKALAGEKVAAIIVWLMGSFSASVWSDANPLALALCTLLLLCSIKSQELDIMASGTNGAALGVELRYTRLLLLGGASVAVSIVVSRFGIIGFVGLVVPHLLRTLFGPGHRQLIFLSALGGASLLCAADTLAKTLGELPTGVLTALIGGPVFCIMLWRRG